MSHGLHLSWRDRRDRTPEAVPVLELSDLWVRVGLREVLRGVSLSVFPGDRVEVRGPNGSGKTSLLNAILGVGPGRVERGRIVCLGQDITGLPAFQRARLGLAYMRQVEQVFTRHTVDENLRLALGPTGPADFRCTWPDWAADMPGAKRAGLLSGGQRKKLAWAMTTLAPRVMILADEPAAGVAGDLAYPEGATSMTVVHEV